VAVVRCECFRARAIVDSVLRSDRRGITRRLLDCAMRNSADIDALCTETDQSLFPVRVLPIAELCCNESGGVLVGDTCNRARPIPLPVA